MKIVYSEDHRLHAPRTELSGGELVEPFERPSRMDSVLRSLAAAGFKDMHDPNPIDMGPVRAIHDAGYLNFLETGWAEWRATGHAGDILPTAMPARRFRGNRVPADIDGKAGYYAFCTDSLITETTWKAVTAGCAVAQTAQAQVAAGDRTAFALCRPPGHHASKDQYGGYCFLNNAAITAQCFLNQGAGRVAILDVDFHHGNGTQDIFYGRKDVLTCSIHGDPAHEFPYFLGYADEKGEGEGEGFNHNFPLPCGTAFGEWREALGAAIGQVRKFAPDAVVVPLGVDTFENDPISSFKLRTPDYMVMGEDIAALALPTLFVMEGGYDIDAIGANVAGVLAGFEGVGR